MIQSNYVVMEGDFNEFTPQEVLEVASLSRQLIQIIFSRMNAEYGMIIMKSGQILDINMPNRQQKGVSAFKELLKGSCDTFQVVRLKTKQVFHKPLGSLVDFLTDKVVERTPKAALPTPPTLPSLPKKSLNSLLPTPLPSIANSIPKVTTPHKSSLSSSPSVSAQPDETHVFDIENLQNMNFLIEQLKKQEELLTQLSAEQKDLQQQKEQFEHKLEHTVSLTQQVLESITQCNQINHQQFTQIQQNLSAHHESNEHVKQSIQNMQQVFIQQIQQLHTQVSQRTDGSHQHEIDRLQIDIQRMIDLSTKSNDPKFIMDLMKNDEIKRWYHVTPMLMITIVVQVLSLGIMCFILAKVLSS